MRLYVIFAFLIVCIIAVNAAQQNPANKRNQLVKKKSTNGAVATNSNHLKAKPRTRPSTKVRKIKKVKKIKKVRKVRPSIGRKPKKAAVRRVVKKSNRRPVAKKVARKSSRNTLRRGSRGGSRKRLAKQELSDTTENKSIGAGQANGGDVADPSAAQAPVAADKPVDTVNQAAPKPAVPAQPAVAPAQPAAIPPSASPDSALSSPAQGANPLSSSPFQIPKAQPGQNQAIGAAFSQSSNGGSAFAAGFASIGKANSAGGYGQVNSSKQASNPASENLNTAEEPAAAPAPAPAETPVDEGSGDQLAAYRRRPRRG